MSFDILIIGGGPAGSCAAFDLAASGMSVAIVEKKRFPREVLCGEFLSEEVLTAIRNRGMEDDFRALHPCILNAFRFISAHGHQATRDLGFDGYAIKRSVLDHFLLSKAEVAGAVVFQPAEVLGLQRNQGFHTVTCRTGEGERTFTAQYVIAAYGRQNVLDKILRRSFASSRSGIVGIKYHIPKTMMRVFPENEIRLYAAQGVYCGINIVSADEATLCYLSNAHVHQVDQKDALTVLLDTNVAFREVFAGDPLLQLKNVTVYGTGNIYFGRRNAVEDGVFMIGDAAGVIAPLAGDGIGMAMESGALVARVLVESRRSGGKTGPPAHIYEKEWNNVFARRMMVARYLQRFAINSRMSDLGGAVLQAFPQLIKHFIRWTRT